MKSLFSLVVSVYSIARILDTKPRPEFPVAACFVCMTLLEFMQYFTYTVCLKIWAFNLLLYIGVKQLTKMTQGSKMKHYILAGVYCVTGIILAPYILLFEIPDTMKVLKPILAVSLVRSSFGRLRPKNDIIMELVIVSLCPFMFVNELMEVTIILFASAFLVEYIYESQRDKYATKVLKWLLSFRKG